MLIFIPNKTGGDVARLFAEVGLEELLREGDAGPNASDLLSAGPSGERGVVLSWGVPGYKPDMQTWSPCKPDANRKLPAGRFLLGFERSALRPDGEADLPSALARSATVQFDGPLVRLADGNAWRIPNGMRLPYRFGLDDAGHVAKVVRPEYSRIHERTLWAFEAVRGEVAGEQAIDELQGLDYCAFLLGLNYRVNLEVCLALGLFDGAAIGRVMFASTDSEKLIAIADEVKKNAAQPPGASGRNG